MMWLIWIQMWDMTHNIWDVPQMTGLICYHSHDVTHMWDKTHICGTWLIWLAHMWDMTQFAELTWFVWRYSYVGHDPFYVGHASLWDMNNLWLLHTWDMSRLTELICDMICKMYNSFHWNCYIPKNHQIEKLRFLGISRYKFKLRFWFNLSLYRGIWVSGFGGVGWGAISVETVMTHMTQTSHVIYVCMCVCVRLCVCVIRDMTHLTKLIWGGFG